MVDGKKLKAAKVGSSVQESTRLPKGGRKGGKIFPRLPLKQALEYSKKLVSKTAVASQPEATILAGVFNNAGPDGKVRLSALKQFGLLEGTSAAYKATQLAREIEAAADEAEKNELLHRAMLTPKVYRELINTYQGDQASKGKIRSRVQQLGVHPDLSDTCADLFMESVVTATMATANGDGVRLIGGSSAAQKEPLPDIHVPGLEEPIRTDPIEEVEKQDEQAEATPPTRDQRDASKLPAPRPRMAADVAVTLTVDSSLDGDKLERQLALLRRYGLI